MRAFGLLLYNVHLLSRNKNFEQVSGFAYLKNMVRDEPSSLDIIPSRTSYVSGLIKNVCAGKNVSASALATLADKASRSLPQDDQLPAVVSL